MGSEAGIVAVLV